MSGCVVAKSLNPLSNVYPLQYGHLLPPARVEIRVYHSFPQSLHFHQALLFAKAVTIVGSNGRFLSDHSAAISGYCEARSLNPARTLLCEQYGRYIDNHFYCKECSYRCTACGEEFIGMPRIGIARSGEQRGICPACYEQVVGVCGNCTIHSDCLSIGANRFCPNQMSGLAA